MNIHIILSSSKPGFGLGRRCAFRWLSMLMSLLVSPYPHWSIPAKISVGTDHLPAPTPDRSFPAWFPLVMKLYVSRRTHESSSYVFFHIIVRSIHKDAHESCIFLCSKKISHLKHRWSTPRVRFTTWRTIS
jgi:hypothetical protein